MIRHPAPATVRWPFALSLALGSLFLFACDRGALPTSPAAQPSAAPGGGSAPVASVDPSGGVSSAAKGKVSLCHRSDGSRGYVPISVAEPAVSAHLAHGDVRVGDPVPGAAGMEFDASCQPVPSVSVLDTTGFFDGRIYWPVGQFTVTSTGSVDATASVTSDYGLPASLRLALLGYNPQGGRDACSAGWLAAPIPLGPAMTPPALTARWANVPPGTYCLSVVNAAPVPPYPAPYSWSARITFP